MMQPSRYPNATLIIFDLSSQLATTAATTAAITVASRSRSGSGRKGVDQLFGESERDRLIV